MAGFPVLTTTQLIVGVDFHKSVPPPAPIMTPHVVVWRSGLSQKTDFMWSAESTSKASTRESGCAKPTAVGNGHACGRTHDAGPHPGHIWPNALLPLIMLGSGSKSEFGSGTVKVAVSSAAGKTADLAINVAYARNTNLDCQDFPLPPMPTGLCFTANYNVTASFTPTDFLRGLIQMGCDLLLSWGVGAGLAVPGFVVGVMGNLTGRAFWAAVGLAFRDAIALKTAKTLMADRAGYFASNGRLFVDAWRFMPTALKYMFKNDPAGTIIGVEATLDSIYAVGTPVGYAPKDARVGGYGSTSLSSKASYYIDGLYK